MEASPVNALKYLMQEHDLKQSDLKEIGSQGVVSEILTGKFSILGQLCPASRLSLFIAGYGFGIIKFLNFVWIIRSDIPVPLATAVISPTPAKALLHPLSVVVLADQGHIQWRHIFHESIQRVVFVVFINLILVSKKGIAYEILIVKAPTEPYFFQFFQEAGIAGIIPLFAEFECPDCD